MGAGLPPTRSAAQDPIKPGLEHLQGWDIHSLSAQPISVPHHPLSEEFLPNICPKYLLFQFKPFALVSTCIKNWSPSACKLISSTGSLRLFRKFVDSRAWKNCSPWFGLSLLKSVNG